MNATPIGSTFRPLGNRPRIDRPGRRFPMLEAVAPVIPPVQWTARSLSHFAWRLHDQNGLGSCNAHAATTALEAIREFNNQPEWPLSAGCLYGQINDGQDEGSTLADALEALLTVGTTTTADVPDDNWHKQTWPTDWKERARRFRATEIYDCPTWPHIISAVQYGWPCDIGIPVHENFEPDDQGIMPDPKGRLLGYHAMCALGTILHAGRWHVAAQNSWGTWGLNASGLAYFPESYFSAPFTDAWCVRVATFPSSP